MALLGCTAGPLVNPDPGPYNHLSDIVTCGGSGFAGAMHVESDKFRPCPGYLGYVKRDTEYSGIGNNQ